jgi:hypothetical protein
LSHRDYSWSNDSAAVDKDLGRTLDSETKVVLGERRQDLVTDRNHVAGQIAPIEEHLRA